MLGPAFFVLLETSIKKGIRAALAFDAGVLISDIIYIVIAYVFIQQVEELSRGGDNALIRSEEHTSELQSRPHLVCRLLLEKKKMIRSSTENPAEHTCNLGSLFMSLVE